MDLDTRVTVRTVIVWLRNARGLRVQVGRILVGEAVVQAVIRELVEYLERRVAASEEETQPDLDVARRRDV